MASHQQAPGYGFHPTSLLVRETDSAAVSGFASSSTATAPSSHHRRDLLALRDSERAKREHEALTTRWADHLMESRSVDRDILRDAANHFQPSHYREVAHERHLGGYCSYPACANPPRRPYSSQTRYELVRNRSGRPRDVQEVTGNPDDGYCSVECRARSIWYEGNLSLEPVWARSIMTPGTARVQQGSTEGQGMTLLEDMESRGEVTWTKTGKMRLAISKATPKGAGPRGLEHTPHTMITISDEPPKVIPASTPHPTTAVHEMRHFSRPSRPTGKADNALPKFDPPQIESLQIIERPTIATTLGKEGMLAMDIKALALPEPPSLERAKGLMDEIGDNGSKGWAPAPRTLRAPHNPGPVAPVISGLPTVSHPPNKAELRIAARQRSSRRRAFDSTSSIVSASMLNLPQDADNVADFSRVMAGASKAGMESVQERERVSNSLNGDPRKRGFGGVSEAEEGSLSDLHGEDGEQGGGEEDPGSEDEDVEFAFAQAELAQQQLDEGTFA